MSVTISRLDIFENLIARVKSRKSGLSQAVNYLEDISREEELQLFYFGGFLRDLWLGEKPRDIDVVFNKLSQERFERITKDKLARKNRFGGLKLNLNGFEIDAWPIEDTYSFSQEEVLPKSINHLPSTVFFNVEAIVLEVYTPVESRWGFENGFFKACSDKVIDIINPNNPFFELQLTRTYHLQRKLGWETSRNLKTYLKENLKYTSGDKLSRTYFEHYGKIIMPKEIYGGIKHLTN